MVKMNVFIQIEENVEPMSAVIESFEKFLDANFEKPSILSVAKPVNQEE